MTKREQYGLTFSKWVEPTSQKIYNLCSRDEVGVYSHLTFIRYISIGEATSLIDEITNALNGEYYDDCPSSDGYADISLELSVPNVIIQEELTVSMLDFKQLLEEWIDFISIEPSQI